MSDTPETKRALDYIYDRDGELWERNAPEKLVTLCRKLERERDESRKKEECYIQEVESLRAEVECLKADAKLYAGWSRWKDGIWRISHPDSGPWAEWIAEDIDELKADKARLERALRQAMDYFWEIENTRWGYDGDCGVVAIANEGSDLIQAVMKGANE